MEMAAEASASAWKHGTGRGTSTWVTVESVDAGVLGPVTVDTSSGPGSTAYSYIYNLTGMPAEPTTAGEMELLITVTDALTFGDHWFLGLLPESHALYDEQIYTCWKYTTTVRPSSRRSARWTR